MVRGLAVYLEIGAKRTFAGAIDWPGWCRSGRGEEEALAALLAYAARYRRVVEAAGLTPPKVGDLDVVERLTGNATTDFGAPGIAPKADDRPVDAAELDRQSRLLSASWQAFDIAWRQADEAGIELTKGPRGGGRDLPKLEDHMLGAEEAYLAGLGSKAPRTPGAAPTDRMATVRETALAALAARAQGTPIADPRNTLRAWAPRYFVRRSAWHALDHAWEIEDRSTGR